MGSWALRCPNCHSKFTDAPLEDKLENYYLPRKLTFPADGKLIDCPTCGHTHS